MRLSKKAEYGLRALAAMARGKKSWSIHELCAQENIPVKFLEQILLALRHAGILSSRRGVGGGYSLVKAPSETTVGEIVRALDGPIAPVPCAAGKPEIPCTCPDPRTCPVRLLMTQFRNEMVEWLDGHTLDDLARLGPAAGGLAFEI
jgi:Rrf2 family protein